MKRFIIITVIILMHTYMADKTHAACSGSSPILTAADATKTEVEACITAAVTGDRINIPSGTETWSSNIIIPNNKKLTIIGAGKESTVITGASFTLGRSGTRISSIGFVNVILQAEGYGFIVDNCKFEQTGEWSTAMIIWNMNSNSPDVPYGLIHSNEFVNIRILAHGTNMSLADGDRTAQHDLWVTTPSFGTFNCVYVENNTFAGGHSIDGNYGGKFVFRFNTITGGLGIEAHGGSNRMIRGWEIYDNILTDDESAFMMIYLRAGTGFVFANTLYNVSTQFTINRVYEGTDLCDGDSLWDGNEITSGDGAGYPCRDQIGRSYDTSLWSHVTTPAYSQPLTPAYLWSNTDNGSREDVYIAMGADYHIVANRDYYIDGASFDGTSGVGVGTRAQRPSNCTQGVAYWSTDQGGNWNTINGTANDGTLDICTATNTWTNEAYTPYTYPHPWRGLTTAGMQFRSPQAGDGSMQRATGGTGSITY